MIVFGGCKKAEVMRTRPETDASGPGSCRIWPLLVGATLGLATCAQPPEPSGDSADEARRARAEYRRGAAPAKPFERAPTSDAGTIEPVAGSVPTDLLEEIRAHAAAVAAVEPDRVELRLAERVTWPDGSLGCPEPGVEYTLEPVPGFRVQVAAAGRLLGYHADMTGRFFLCDPARLRKPGPAQ